jgi:hypothetical protein
MPAAHGLRTGHPQKPAPDPAALPGKWITRPQKPAGASRTPGVAPAGIRPGARYVVRFQTTHTHHRRENIGYRYDAPRTKDDDQGAQSLEALQASRAGAQTAVIDLDEADTAEGIDLPGADLSGEELVVTIVPPQLDEFTCMSCFLVRHRSQVAREKDGMKFCGDCEG